jgi:hypothetical protein
VLEICAVRSSGSRSIAESITVSTLKGDLERVGDGQSPSTRPTQAEL